MFLRPGIALIRVVFPVLLAANVAFAQDAPRVINLETRNTEELIASTDNLRQKLWDDPQRPRYHFMPRQAWMNDINGAIFWKGRYHIFYQHNPEGGYWKWMQWGHASSVDLMHWVHHPIALTPDRDGPDQGGCFSGGAFLNKQGTPTFIYHGVSGGTCLATADDDLLIHWTKHPANPVIRVPQEGEPGHGKYIVFDPTAWLEGDTYFALIGNRIPGTEGDATALFTSKDLEHWEFVGPFYKSHRRWTDTREDCAVPDFFGLGNKHMLLFCSHLQGTQYYLGRWNGKDSFEVETHGWMHWPGGHLGGPRSLLDDKGRRIFFDWIREIRGDGRERASGWSGVMTLPRILSLAEDGSTLLIEPVPELEVLRFNPRTRQNIDVAADADIKLDDINGDNLELAVEMQPNGAKEFGVTVRCSADGAEQTLIICEPSANKLKIDISKSTLDEEIRKRYNCYRGRGAPVKAQEAPFELRDGESLKLRIFVDRSVLEVFANGRQCITQRIHPTCSDSLGVALFSRGGGAKVISLEAWEMAPANSY